MATVLIGAHNANNIRKCRRVRHANVFALFTRQVVTSAIVTGSRNQNTGIISIFQCFFYGNRNEGATEGHIDNGSTVHVSVGEVAHPMIPEHYIEWIALQTKTGVQRKELKPGEKPEACFALCDGDEVVAVYAYCNLHGLWKA